MSDFQLNERLAADTFFVTDLALCSVLLMNDARYPWLILVPRVGDMTEIHHLSSEQQHLLMEESAKAGQLLESLFKPTSINVAALGNVVSQLHVHHIARFSSDPAWPGPVWGHSSAVPYTKTEIATVLSVLQPGFAE